MAANQKPLNQIGIFWYQFTPRKLLYLMILVNFVKFGPHWLSVFIGPLCIYKSYTIHDNYNWFVVNPLISKQAVLERCKVEKKGGEENLRSRVCN